MATDQKYIEAARERRRFAWESMQIDDNAVVERNEIGAWVQAWIYVDNSDVQEET